MNPSWFDDIVMSNSEGLIRLPYKLLRISGIDSKQYLQGQLTINMDKLEEDFLKPGLYCAANGRIIADYWIYQHEQDYFLILHETILDETINLLKKFAVFSKVHFSIEASPLIFTDLDSKKYALGNEPSFKLSPFLLGQVAKIHSDPNIYFFFIQPEDLKEGYSQQSEDWELIQIYLGSAHIVKETQSQWLPHRLDYHQKGYLDFNKGCYLGQEVIARMHYKSQHKHQLFHIAIEDELQLNVGDKLKAVEPRFDMDIVNTSKKDHRTHALISIDKQHAGIESILLDTNQTLTVKWIDNA